MDNWMAKLFRDPGFSILMNSGGGDCLFHVVSQATGIAYSTLKAAVASKVTQEEFEVKMHMYQSAKKQYYETKKRCYLLDIYHYRWMEGIQSLDQYKKALVEQGRWGDGESVEHLEQLLECRILLLSRNSPLVAHHHLCPVKHPKFYIMANYIDSAHFELITYNGYKCFLKGHLPFVVKRIFHLADV